MCPEGKMREISFQAHLCPHMSSSAIQRRSTRASVLGKRSHRSQVDSTSSPAGNKSLSHDLLDDDDDASTVDWSPCAKRPRTSIAPADGHGNKENIPPLRIDCPEESSRALRRSSTEFLTPTRTRMRMASPIVFLYISVLNNYISASACIDIKPCISTGQTDTVGVILGVTYTSSNTLYLITYTYSDSCTPSCNL